MPAVKFAVLSVFLIDLRMDRFAPTTTDYGLLAMPLEKAASAFAVYCATGSLNLTQSDLEGSVDDVFLQLEPLSMALDRTLFVSNGENWTSYFANGLLGSDAFLPVSRIAAAHQCTGLRVVKAPKATIFEAYECPERGGSVTNHRRTIYAAQDGRWVFGSTGEPYPFEDVSRYEAKWVRDRFTPDFLADLLKGLGAPLEPFPKVKKLRAILFVRENAAPQLSRWTYHEVQAGLPWKRA